MNLAHWLARAGCAHPDAPAVGFGAKTVYDYRTLSLRAAKLAGGLLSLGMTRGDRVAIISKNQPDYVAIMFGIMHAGLSSVPANAKLHGAELGYILEHSGARVCFVSEDMESEVAAHAPKSLERMIRIKGTDYERLLQADPVPVADVGGEHLAWLFYTSGTTGRPKGAMLTQRNLNWAAHAYLTEVDETNLGDPILHAAPMSHGSGMYILPHIAKAGVNIVPESGAFDPEEIFALIDRWPRLSMFAAPTMIKRLVDSSADCNAENIRTFVWGGAPMYVEDVRRALDRFGPRLAQIYGQGESPMTITKLSKAEVADSAHPRWLERIGSAGTPYACLEVRVADEQDNALPVGEIGEILCRGDIVMAGYWKNEEASTKTLANGWLHTGDVGAFDADGYLTLKDRSKDMIISGGSNIYPREVEEILLRHEKVREVSVIGRPDAEWGEIVVAYVVGEVGEKELDALCLSAIARFKRPKEYVFVDALPKNNYGKILKTELRECDAAKGKQHG
ncbi:MAG TPA: AMP-binding protein [Xanthobacteraceae bacterium]|nr:AMP-binding protein [Xanthobacteraceae bacterium]